jgi:hypothetical protein
VRNGHTLLVSYVQRTMSEPSEFMLILGADDSPGNHGGRYRVTQKVSPRVLLIQPVGGITKEELHSLNGVTTVLAPGERPAAEIRATLTDTEALFADAFAQRSQSKQRLGEGLAWDTEGFLPPDPPKR